MRKFDFLKKMKNKKSELDREVSQFVTEVSTILHIEETVANALRRLRESKVSDKIIYFYVVDENHHLKGIVSTRDLLLATPDTMVADITERSIIKLSTHDTLKQALETFARHRLLALPVIDQVGKLTGVVDVELYMEGSFNAGDSAHRRDVFQLLGLTIEEKTSTWRGYKLRMPWLLCNMVGGFACAIISRIQEAVISKYLVLAMFIPLVLTLSESVSMQSMTQSLQFLRKSRPSFKYALYKILREWKTVALLSLTAGLVVGSISLLWQEGPHPSTIIGIGIFVSVILSSAFGIMIPIFLHAFRLDPKVASGPVVLMFADVLTTLFYLTLASYWLL